MTDDAVVEKMVNVMRPISRRDLSDEAWLEDKELYDMAKAALAALEPGDEIYDGPGGDDRVIHTAESLYQMCRQARAEEREACAECCEAERKRAFKMYADDPRVREFVLNALETAMDAIRGRGNDDAVISNPEGDGWGDFLDQCGDAYAAEEKARQSIRGRRHPRAQR